MHNRKNQVLNQLKRIVYINDYHCLEIPRLGSYLLPRWWGLELQKRYEKPKKNYPGFDVPRYFISFFFLFARWWCNDNHNRVTREGAKDRKAWLGLSHPRRIMLFTKRPGPGRLTKRVSNALSDSDRLRGQA